ncbi:regulatory protein RecX [Candidatus Chloroploca sp. Khr17]|uniref:regulatory protein RecX n=1 Tax=Candidatus Chloroploca sp. Khr17 TaxID=2496869 RepID=UPI00101C399F|nr:RecX family transcriptional regulator [Candidatus Chloroploca sp. Khr17]
MPAGTITAITAQAHDSQRVNIFIDGAFALGISLATLARESLWIGLTLDDAAWQRLAASAQVEQALLSAMRLLDARPRSRAEVRLRLRQKEHPPQVIDQVLERLQDLGLLDDAAFSRYWVENRQRFRPRGVRALVAELRSKGVDRDTIATALAEVGADAEGERQAAEQVARSVLARYCACPDRATFQRRLGGLLQRRGFALAVIRPLLETLWYECSASQGDET